MSKHTKAPWKVAKAEPFRLKSGCYIQAVFSLSDATFRPARAQGETAEECQANAHLIAAAPELLEVLRSLVDRARLVTDNAFGVWRIESSIDGVIAEARVAIAKAEGREA